MQLEARERLAVNTYLQQLTQPQVAFSVKQRRPVTLDDAVTATLEMESYTLSLGHTEPVSAIQPTDIEPVSAGATNEPVPVSAISSTEKLTSIVERLSEQVETLQREVRQSRNARDFQFKVMPFGLCNAPATFQRLMDLVLAGLQWSDCLVYLDDVVVLGCTFEEHLCNLSSVLQRMREAGLRLKPSKCSFFQREVHYLGHIISRDGVATDPAKIEKVATWPALTSKREVQQFLGLAGYYR